MEFQKTARENKTHAKCRTPHVCLQCGQEFLGEPDRKFCSTECWHKYKAAHKEVRNLPRGARTEYICKNCGCDFSDLSCKAARVFCSMECKADWQSRNLREENNPNYKADKDTPKNWKSDIRWVEWREAVFARDTYTCQACGATGVYLEPHHIRPKAIYPYPDLVYDIGNGSSVCRTCHRKLHAIVPVNQFTPANVIVPIAILENAL